MALTRDWVSEAGCAGLPTDLFYLDRGMTKADEQVRVALKVCARCEVRSQCLDDALAYECGTDRHGIFGGLTPQERVWESRNRIMAETGMCPKGHAMTEENTGIRWGNRTWRFCRVCRDEHRERYSS